MRKLLLVAGLAAGLGSLAACADDHYAMYGRGADVAYVGTAVGYDGFYDDAYGPFYDGYWGGDGSFYYSDGQGHGYRRDAGHHFRHDQGPGFHAVHGGMHAAGAHPDGGDRR